LNKQSKELKFNLSKSNILGKDTLDNYRMQYEENCDTTNVGDVSMIQSNDIKFQLGRNRPVTAFIPPNHSMLTN